MFLYTSPLQKSNIQIALFSNDNKKYCQTGSLYDSCQVQIQESHKPNIIIDLLLLQDVTYNKIMNKPRQEISETVQQVEKAF